MKIQTQHLQTILVNFLLAFIVVGLLLSCKEGDYRTGLQSIGSESFVKMKADKIKNSL